MAEALKRKVAVSEFEEESDGNGSDETHQAIFRIIFTSAHSRDPGSSGTRQTARDPWHNSADELSGESKLSLVLFESADGVAVITLNRPDKLNSFAGTMREDLLAALTRAEQDPAISVVMITGAGRAFCAGGDVAYMRELQKESRTSDLQTLLDAGAGIVTIIARMPKFVIASINGVAAGAGCNLALACDYRIAARGATFAQSFVRIGLHPDWGGTFFLPRLVGASRAMEMMATGRAVDAEEAFRIGLVDRVVEDGALGEEAAKLALAISGGPPIAISRIKIAISRSGRSSLEDQLALESRHQVEAFESADSREGINAFFEKRRPKFEGR